MDPIKLSKPIGVGTNARTEIVFKREPTLGEIADSGVNVRDFVKNAGPSLEEAIRLTVLLSDVPEVDVRSASPNDWMAIIEGVTPFLVPSGADVDEPETTDE